MNKKNRNLKSAPQTSGIASFDDTLSAETLRNAFKGGTIGREIIFFESVDSTNDSASSPHPNLFEGKLREEGIPEANRGGPGCTPVAAWDRDFLRIAGISGLWFGGCVDPLVWSHVCDDRTNLVGTADDLSVLFGAAL